MNEQHLVLSGANDYLANGDGASLRVFETRVADAIGNLDASAKASLINDIVDRLEHNGGAGDRVHVLLEFLDSQRLVVQAE